MPEIGISSKNAEKIKKRLKLFGRSVEKRVASALLSAGRRLLLESNRYVPVETGKLLESGKVRRFQFPGFKTVVQVGYGGYVSTDAYYSVYVHENTAARHGVAYNAYYAKKIKMGLVKPRKETERAKFLQYAMYTHLKDIRDTFERSILRKV